MYQNCCKKCGSISLHTEIKGNNTGLYCDNCGAWIKWLGKDELNAFNYAKEEKNKDIEKSMELVELNKRTIAAVVGRLIGEITPTGDCDADRVRFTNNETLGYVAWCCVDLLIENAEYSVRPETSVSAIGESAEKALRKIVKEIKDSCVLDY